MDCNSCKEKNPSPVPYIVYESSLSRAERNFKRMFWAFVAVLIALFITNAAWIYCWQQYDYSSTSTDIVQDGQGLNIVGDRNNVGKLIEMCDEDEGYSSRSYRSDVEPGRDMPSYRSYARGRRNAPRDSMGRYSGDGYSMHGAADKLRELMDEAPDEQTRRELERLAAKMER